MVVVWLGLDGLAATEQLRGHSGFYFFGFGDIIASL